MVPRLDMIIEELVGSLNFLVAPRAPIASNLAILCPDIHVTSEVVAVVRARANVKGQI